MLLQRRMLKIRLWMNNNQQLQVHVFDFQYRFRILGDGRLQFLTRDHLKSPLDYFNCLIGARR